MEKSIDSDRVIQHCKDAVRLWGEHSQADQCIEECSELIQAIIKFRRGLANSRQVIEELADVEIMILQMSLTMRKPIWKFLMKSWTG